MSKSACIKIPYGKGHKEIVLEDSRVKAVLASKVESYKADCSQEDIVQNALNNPIQSERLAYIAKEAKNVLLITSDHTRPVPSKITLPILLKEIRAMNPDIKIKILIATGFHRPTTREEMIQKFGSDIVNNEEIINHDSTDTENMVFKGILPSGGELWLNSLVDWADLVVSEGFIEPHFFAGFSGGRKSILPGIASKKTIFANHCSKFIASSHSRAGKLDENPIHKDMLFAANAAKLRFILNVVIDGEKKIINAFAGHPEAAHLEGCRFVKELAGVNAVSANIVVTSNGGYPLDQNVYQAVKGMTAAEACVNEGGVIIMFASCIDGHGGEEFYKWFANAASPEEVASKIASIPQEDTIADQWEAQILARILMKCKVIMVSEPSVKSIIENMHMLYASSFDEALQMAEQIIEKQEREQKVKLAEKDKGIVIIPDGVGVIVE